MPSSVKVSLITPHVGQRAILRNLRRFNVARMGRRWGKTAFGIDYLMSDYGGYRGALSEQGPMPVAWFAPTYRYIDDPWREMHDRLGPAIRKSNEQKHRIELWSGGSVEFWTCDGEDPARGRKYAKVFVDEAAMIRRLLDKWNKAIRPTLTDMRGGAMIASTPKGKNDFHELDQRSQKTATANRWASFHAPSTQNPYISREEIEEARIEIPELVFRQEYQAEYVDFGGALVRAEWIQHGQPELDYPIVLGVDLAISTKESANYTAIVAMTRSKQGHIYILGAWRFRAQFDTILRTITQTAKTMNAVRIGVENVQFQAAVVQELLRRTDLNVIGVGVDKDKLTRYIPMVARYEQGLVHHADTLPKWYVDEVLSFTGGPDDLSDDGVDATSVAYRMLPNLQVSIATAQPRVM